MKVTWYSIDHTLGIWRMNELVLYKIWTLYILPCDQMLVYIGYQKHVIMANKKLWASKFFLKYYYIWEFFVVDMLVFSHFIQWT